MSASWNRTLLLAFLLFGLPALAQFVPITHTNITDATGAPLASGQECFTPVTNARVPIPATYQGTVNGTITKLPKCGTVTNGSLQAGFQLVSSNATQPRNLCYMLTIRDLTTGQYLIGPNDGWTCLQPTAPMDLSTFSPNVPGLTVAVVGPKGDRGDIGLIGAAGLPGAAGPTGAVSGGVALASGADQHVTGKGALIVDEPSRFRLAPVYGGGDLCFGDSLAYGNAAPNYQYQYGYCNLVANAVGGEFYDYGVGGDYQEDTTNHVFYYATPSDRNNPAVTMQSGTNNVYFGDPNGTVLGRQNNYYFAKLAAVSYLTTPAVNSVYAVNWIRSSGWTNNTTPYGGPVANYPTSATGVAASESSTSGATASVTIYGNASGVGVLWYRAFDGNGGTFSVTVNGANLGNLASYGFNGQCICTHNSGTSTVFAYFFPTVPGNNNVTVQVTSATLSTNVVSLIGIASGPTPVAGTNGAYQPGRVFDGGVPYESGDANSGGTAMYDGLADAAVNLLSGYGYLYAKAPVRTFWFDHVHNYVDGLHPDIGGHQLIADAYLSVMQPVSPEGHGELRVAPAHSVDIRNYSNLNRLAIQPTTTSLATGVNLITNLWSDTFVKAIGWDLGLDPTDVEPYSRFYTYPGSRFGFCYVNRQTIQRTQADMIAGGCPVEILQDQVEISGGAATTPLNASSMSLAWNASGGFAEMDFINNYGLSPMSLNRVASFSKRVLGVPTLIGALYDNGAWSSQKLWLNGAANSFGHNLWMHQGTNANLADGNSGTDAVRFEAVNDGETGLVSLGFAAAGMHLTTTDPAQPVTANLFAITPGAPANSADTCTVGQIKLQDPYLYVCFSANSWKRFTGVSY